MKITAITTGILLGLLGLSWIIQGNEFFLYKVFAPRTEAVRRQVFEQSRAFNQGMVQELENMRFQYHLQGDPGVRASLADVILHRAAGYDMDDPAVPSDLRSFVSNLKRDREGAR